MKKITLLLLLVALAVLCVMPTVALAETEPLLNLKMNFMDSENYALSGYIVTIDNDHQSVTTKDGVASFPAVKANQADTFKLYTPDGKTVVSTCNLTYQKANKTDVGTTSTNGTYVIYYSTENATIYIDMIADPNGNSSTLMHPAMASDNPLPTGKQRPAPTAKPSASASASAPAQPTTVTNPSMEGYLVDTNGTALSGDIVESRNDDTGNSLSGTTDPSGYYYIQGLSDGKHTISVFREENPVALGSVDLFVETGKTTEMTDVNGDGVLDIRTGLNKLYINLQLDDAAKTVTVLDVSDSPLNSPATSTEAPTVEPTEAPTAEPSEEPTAEPSEEPTAAPTVEPAPEPAPAPSGMDSNLMIILIVVIVAVAAVVIVLIVVKSRRR